MIYQTKKEDSKNITDLTRSLLVALKRSDPMTWIKPRGKDNNERCHLAVGRDSPSGREIQNKPFKSAKIISSPRIGGLHHVYK